MPTLVCTAKASFKKNFGTLELTDTHLLWTQEGKKNPSARIAKPEILSLFCSKEGNPQVRMKVSLVKEENSFTFTFTSPQAIPERERFKQELTATVAQNRLARDATPKPTGLALPSPAPSSIVKAELSVTPQPPLPVTALPPTSRPRPAPTDALRQSVSRADSIAPDRANSPVIPGYDSHSDFQLRKRVLLSNSDLAALHRDLVVLGGQITEAEFWDGREHLLLTQAAEEKQQKGKSGQLVDPRPQTVEGGEIKIRLTPQLVQDIFDEYPIVAKAHAENVPSKLNEENFWKRYFQSKLFHSHRASIRSTAAQHVVKEDDIFDQYLEDDDNEIAPRKQRNEKVDLLVDLVAILEDHEETGNEKDVTMQAGRQKGALPLIRRFNEHSERLLNSALGVLSSESPRKEGDHIYRHIDLDDLRDAENSAGIRLEALDRQRYFEGRMQPSCARSQIKRDARLDVNEAILQLGNWQAQLAQLKQNRTSGDVALSMMSQNVAARLNIKSRKNEIPDGLFRQMASCQTAANEFLRQYWSAVHPPPVDLAAASLPTPAQRTAKAIKMISYLSTVHEKVDALVQMARAHNLDAQRVELAMNPIQNAVDQALAHDKTRKPIR